MSQISARLTAAQQRISELEQENQLIASERDRALARVDAFKPEEDEWRTEKRVLERTQKNLLSRLEQRAKGSAQGDGVYSPLFE